MFSIGFTLPFQFICLPPSAYFNGPLCESLMDLLELSGAENNICVNVKITENEQMVRFHSLITIYNNVKCESAVILWHHFNTLNMNLFYSFNLTSQLVKIIKTLQYRLPDDAQF